MRGDRDGRPPGGELPGDRGRNGAREAGPARENRPDRAVDGLVAHRTLRREARRAPRLGAADGRGRGGDHENRRDRIVHPGPGGVLPRSRGAEGPGRVAADPDRPGRSAVRGRARRDDDAQAARSPARGRTGAVARAARRELGPRPLAPPLRRAGRRAARVVRDRGAASRARQRRGRARARQAHRLLRPRPVAAHRSRGPRRGRGSAPAHGPQCGRPRHRDAFGARGGREAGRGSRGGVPPAARGALPPHRRG